MSYNEDVVISKLSTLNESSDAIVNVSQWIMFHKRHAQKSAEIWAKQVQKAPANKKLAMIYLANEVVQQCRAKRKEEFVKAFASIVADALGTAYKQVPKEIKDKIKRTVDVWKQRNIFDKSVIEQLEQNMYSEARPVGLGFGSGVGVPPDLKEIAASQQVIDDQGKAADTSYGPAVTTFQDLFDSDALPAPPAYSKQLGKLQEILTKSIAQFDGSVAARRKLGFQLQNLVQKNERALEQQEKNQQDLKSKLEKTIQTKQEVDEMLVEEEEEEEEQPNTAVENAEDVEIEAPEVEAFTPPGEEPNELAQETVDEYFPDEDTNNAAPAYSPNSSDDEEAEQPEPKRAKTEESINYKALDPTVAQLLAKFQK